MKIVYFLILFFIMFVVYSIKKPESVIESFLFSGFLDELKHLSS